MDWLLSGGWWLVPAIFLARTVDVSLGTFRSIVVFRGYRGLAAFIGFFEILIWVMAAGTVLNNLDAWYLAVAYAAGFAAGNFVGMSLESRIAMGHELVRAVHFGGGDELARALKQGGYGLVALDAHSGDGQTAEVVYVVEKRRRTPELVEFIHQHCPNAFVTVADVKEHGSKAALLTEKPLINAGWRTRGKRK